MNATEVAGTPPALQFVRTNGVAVGRAFEARLVQRVKDRRESSSAALQLQSTLLSYVLAYQALCILVALLPIAIAVSYLATLVS